MQASQVTYSPLPGGADPRGGSYSLDDIMAAAMPRAAGCHAAYITPGHVRGDHFHAERHEIILVLAQGPWALFWDEGEHTQARRQDFSDEEAIVVQIGPGASHAIKNTGAAPLMIVALADRYYDPVAPDSYRRKVSA